MIQFFLIGPDIMKYFSDNNTTIINELLEPFREINPNLPEGESIKIKTQNSGLGVSAEAQWQINRFADKVRSGKFDEVSKRVKLKLVDLFTLYANHLDQQISEVQNAKLPVKDKQATALSWIEAANHLFETIVPDLSNSIAQKNCSYDNQLLSSLSMMLHYLGKMRRYNPAISIEDRLPLLEYAVSISKHLAPFKGQEDRHYYSDRTSTFEAPVIITYCQLKRFDEATLIVQTQLEDSTARRANFHIIQGNTRLSDIARDDKRFDDAIEYATNAVNFILESAERGEEDFTHNTLYYNARVSLMNAHQEMGNHDEARHIAEAMRTEYEKDPNCGLKESYHLKEIDKILDQAPSSTLSI